MRADTVAESFARYRAAVIPRDASPVQILECERAWYAATHSLLGNLLTHLGDASSSEEDGVAQLVAMQEECERYGVAGHVGAADTAGAPVPPPDFQTTADTAVRPIAKEVGRLIAAQLPDGWGFTLLLFSFGEGGTLSYLSNADRGDMILAMHEFIRRQTQ